METKDIDEATQFRHSLIQEEFRSILASGEYKIPAETNGVVVLSAAPAKDEKGNIIGEFTPDNIARIEWGVEIIREIAARKTGRDLQSVNQDDIFQYAPPLILNGETEQLSMMLKVAQGLDINPGKIILLNSGDRYKSNTKTQFEVLENDSRLGEVNHLTFITNAWHVPRVLRTADKQLKPSIHFDVIPVPNDKVPYSVYRVVRGEVKRIESYSAKGDITHAPLPRS